MSSLVPALIAFVASWAALAWLRKPGRLPADPPNQRSLHARTTPRGGGLAIWLGFIAACVWTLPIRPWLPPLLMMIAVSLWDDRRGLPVIVRLAIHLAAAALWFVLEAGSGNIAIAIIAIVWMANLFNFMDGSDGLAATMAILGFGAYSLASAATGNADVPLMLALPAATVPFLFFNLPPAKVFLGDVGAVPLGFLAAVWGISGWQTGSWPAWFPVLVFLPFIADATLTLIRRLVRGQRIWEPHRAHFYQKLVQLGLGHRGTLALYAALMAGTSLSAVAALLRAPAAGTLLLGLWAIVLTLLYISIDHSWQKSEQP
jgi:UDP-N-acetylmuramyl pentapeptide phosphotransferase/UDP-N-acetylglucosamine-1-phosphate transferase